MKYKLTGSVSLSKNTQPRSTRVELLRVDEETGKPYRDYSKHIDVERTPWNRVLVNRDVREVYDEHIGPGIKEYNAKQIAGKHPHPERCKSLDGYMEEILAGERAKNGTKRPRLWNDIIIQCGDMLTNEAWQVVDGKKVQPELALITNKVYEEFVVEFQKKFQNLIVTCSATHNDEACPHCMIQYSAICHNNSRGLPVQVKLMDALAESLDALNIPYNRKRDDGVKHAFNKVLDEILTDVMRRHSIERVPGKPKEDKELQSVPVAELRKRSRLLREKVKMIVDRGENPLDALEAKRIPFVGTVYSEHDMRALINEMMKERAILMARAENAEEIGRREKASQNETVKRLNVKLQKRERNAEKDFKKREASIKQKEREAERILKEAQAYKWSLEDRDQQYRYKRLADELALEKAEVTEMKERLQADSQAIIESAKTEAERIKRDAEKEGQKEKVKIRILEERYPQIANELESIVQNTGKKSKLLIVESSKRERSKSNERR